MTMTDIKSILVPVDFSLGSRAALRQAAMIAERFGAKIEVLHLWEPSPIIAPNQLMWASGDADEFWRDLQADLRRRLDEMIAEEVPKQASAISCQVEAGYVAHAILKRIERGRYDLVVMGTHGRTGLSHVVMGSVAERVVRMSPSPVMTVRIPKAQEKAEEEERRRAHEPVAAVPVR